MFCPSLLALLMSLLLLVHAHPAMHERDVDRLQRRSHQSTQQQSLESLATERRAPQQDSYIRFGRRSLPVVATKRVRDNYIRFGKRTAPTRRLRCIVDFAQGVVDIERCFDNRHSNDAVNNMRDDFGEDFGHGFGRALGHGFNDDFAERLGSDDVDGRRGLNGVDVAQ